MHRGTGATWLSGLLGTSQTGTLEPMVNQLSLSLVWDSILVLAFTTLGFYPMSQTSSRRQDQWTAGGGRRCLEVLVGDHVGCCPC